MTPKEKIELLIQAKTKENNFIAIQLMINEENLNFEEAFSRLKVEKIGARSYIIEILDVKVLYKYTPVTFDHYVIQRLIYLKNDLISQKQVYVDEDPIYQVSEEFLEEYIEFKKDRISIASKIEALINKTNG